MKILVGYKRVVDYNVRIQVKPDGSGVVTDGVKLSPNPFDDIALEEALRLRDKGIATEVVVATIAPADAQAHLRNGLGSLGADVSESEGGSGRHDTSVITLRAPIRRPASSHARRPGSRGDRHSSSRASGPTM